MFIKAKHILAAMRFLAILIPLSMLAACGGGGNDSSGTFTATPPAETGSIQFSLEWQSSPPAAPDSFLRPQLALDCAASGVSKVAAKVYDETNSLLASGEWDCAAHTGTINEVKAGTNRTLVILGKNSQGENIFVGGPISGIILSPNQSYNAGIITVIPYNITLSSPANEATITGCELSFQWFAAQVGRFEIQIDEQSDFLSPVLSQILTENSYAPGDLSPGLYYWRVRSVDNLGNPSQWSETRRFTLLFQIGEPPSAPAGIQITGADTRVLISWDDVLGATSYNLYWSLSPGVSKTTGIKIANVSSPFTHLGRINGTTYYYVLTAANTCGESGESAQVSAIPGKPPSAPGGIQITGLDTRIRLSWNPVSQATNYNLYWSLSPDVSKVSGIKIQNVSSPFTHLGRTNGTTYYYVLTATNSYGESEESVRVSAIPGRPPEAPTGVRAEAGKEEVTISWDNAIGATSYNIYWNVFPGVSKTNGIKIANVTSPFLHTGLNRNIFYFYVVTAVNSYGESDESSTVGARPNVND